VNCRLYLAHLELHLGGACGKFCNCRDGDAEVIVEASVVQLGSDRRVGPQADGHEHR
jgi:hypothetical protein